MRITVFGATGRIGSAVVAEAHERGHEVTAAIHRRPASVPAGVATERVDLEDEGQVRAACAGRDVVVSAIGWTPEQPDDLLGQAARAMLEAVRGTDTRLLIVGGAGTLLTETGLYVDSPTFPPDRRRNSLAHVAALTELRGATNNRWTYLCPPAVIAPGGRTGQYRVGDHRMLDDPQGAPRISIVDFAVALVDLATADDPTLGHCTVAY
jgi:putative NADH-flavin reductase